MKKFFKIALVNFAIIILLVIFTEILCAVFIVKQDQIMYFAGQQSTLNPKIPKLSVSECLMLYYHKIREYYSRFDNENYVNTKDFRKPAEGILYSNKKENIVLSGCFYTYGLALEYNDTFGVILSDYLKKYKVYNIGISGASPREALYILRNYDKYSKLGFLPEDKDNTKYFIYTYMGDQPRRILFDMYKISPNFKVYKDEQNVKRLEFYRPNNLILRSFIYKMFLNYCIPDDNSYFNNLDYLIDLYVLYIKEMKREVNKIFPNAEFVLFMYINCDDKMMEFLRKEDINVVRLGDISKKTDFFSKEYMAWDGAHPNRKAWEAIVPLLSEKLDL